MQVMCLIGLFSVFSLSDFHTEALPLASFVSKDRRSGEKRNIDPALHDILHDFFGKLGRMPQILQFVQEGNNLVAISETLLVTRDKAFETMEKTLESSHCFHPCCDVDDATDNCRDFNAQVCHALERYVRNETFCEPTT